MSVKITENGFSAVKICIPPNPGEVLRFAAKELASYLYRISKSGTRIWENGETGPGMISISAGKDWEQDSFSVKAENAAVSIHGSNPRGALFGVYELLERIGCVFAGPFDEYVPSILGIELDDFSVTQTASFDRRSVFNTLLIFNRSVHFDGFEPERFLPQIAWLAKRKLNTFVFSVDFNRYDLWDSFRFQAMEELQKRGMKICLVNCSVEYFFPQSEQQDAGNYGTSTYASEHPEYYDAKGFLKINMPEVRRITAERCAAYIASHTELESAALAPSPKLLAHVSPDGTSFMTHYLALFNETARILSVAAPEKKLMVLLHGSLLDLPDGFQFEKNILPVFSSSGVNFHYDRQHSLNSKEYAREKRLAEKIPFVLVDNLGNESSLTPLCGIIRKNLCAFHALGAAGAFAHAGPSYNFLANKGRRAMDFYVYSCLLWNLSGNADEYRMQWLRGMFCEAAGTMLEFYRLLETRHETLSSQYEMKSTAPWMDLMFCREAQKLLDTARSAVLSERVRERIDAINTVMLNSCVYRVFPHGRPPEDEYIQ